MMTRFFPPLIWLLLASAAAAQSWHDDSRYVSLGPRTGYYIVRPGSHLSRQLGLEGAPISDTADPFRHGYGADALAFQFDRAGRLLRAPAYVAQAQLNNFYISRLVSLSAEKARPRKYDQSLVLPQNRTTTRRVHWLLRDRSLQSL